MDRLAGHGQSRDAYTLYSDLLPVLEGLDRLLFAAVETFDSVHSAQISESFRGLFIAPEETRLLLARKPGESPIEASGPWFKQLAEELAATSPQIAHIQHVYDLSTFDLCVILIALVPELDLRYERIFAYLQDNVSKRRPTVDLLLNLLTSMPEDKLVRRQHFYENAPLLQGGLVRLVSDERSLEIPLLGHFVSIEEQLVRFLLGDRQPHPELAPFAEFVTPVPVVDRPTDYELVKSLAGSFPRAASPERRPAVIQLCGPADVCRDVVRHLASVTDTTILAVDLDGLVAAGVRLEYGLQLLARTQALLGYGSYIEEPDGLASRSDSETVHACLSRYLAACPGPAIVGGITPSPWIQRRVPDAVVAQLAVPGYHQRHEYWRCEARHAGWDVDGRDLTEAAHRFRLGREQIRNAARALCADLSTGWPLPEGSQDLPIARDELFRAARAQLPDELAGLTRKLEPRYCWTDIVINKATLAQLREICARVRDQHVVYEDWGFGRKHRRGMGASVLFSGCSGSGKTMAAEVLASDLGLDLYTVDIPQVVSKYIGETEKNLDRIFTAASGTDAILFFDEADALFGKRSTVEHSHDRYANLEVAYLLQRIEDYEGVVILATNLRPNMDEAFVRRLAHVVEFDFPDADQRRDIWSAQFPPTAPCADDVDLAFLAQQFSLSGGSIKNAALTGAFLAATTGEKISMPHLVRGVKREYQKLGRMCGPVEFGHHWPQVESYV